MVSLGIPRHPSLFLTLIFVTVSSAKEANKIDWLIDWREIKNMLSLFPLESLYVGSSRYLASCWTSSCRWRPSPWQPGVSWRPSTRCTSCCFRTSTPSWQWTRPPGTNSKNAESWMGCHSVSALEDNSSSWGRITRASGSACCHSPRTWRRGAWMIQRNYPTSITGKGGCGHWALQDAFSQSFIMVKRGKSSIMFYIVTFVL